MTNQGRRAAAPRATSAALLLSLVLAACAGPRPAPAVSIAVERPDGPGRHPVAVLVPDCGGRAGRGPDGHYARVARWFAERGFLALTVDYAGAGGAASACGDISLDTVNAHVREAVEQARRLPQADPARIHVVGWGWGGAGVLAALTDDAAPTGVRAAAAYYPVCAALARDWRTSVPTIILVGEADRVTPSSECLARLDRAIPAPPVMVARYPGVHHGFDVAEYTPPVDVRGGLLGPVRRFAYDGPARDSAWHDVIGFFADR